MSALKSSPHQPGPVVLPSHCSTSATETAVSSACKSLSILHISPEHSTESASPPTVYQQSLPNELIIQILYHALHLRGQSVPPLPVDWQRFQCHVHRLGRLGRYLVTSRSLYPLVLEAFYRENEFRCTSTGRMIPVAWNEAGLVESPIRLPPVHTRHYVRRLDVTISLCHFRHTFTTSLQWRTLVNLCSATTGFSRLEFLRLVIEDAPCIHHKDVITLMRLRMEGFVIRAKKEVVIEGWRGAGPFFKVEAEVVRWI
jgi:hypothetical protein